MKNDYVTSVFAGIVSAILYLSLATGTALAAILVYLAPLPIVIIALGWGRSFGFLSGIVGCLIVTLLSPNTLILGVTYLTSSVVPFIFLAHLAHINQVVSKSDIERTQIPVDASEMTEDGYVIWYPVAGIIIWAATISATLAVVFVSLLGTTLEAYTASIDKLLEQQFFAQMRKVPEFNLTDQEIARVKKLTTGYLPAITTGLYFIFIVLNFWFGAVIVKKSERLQRPWPNLANIDYPAQFSIVLAVLMVLVMIMPGIYGVYTTAFLSAVLCAYALVGMMVLHRLIDNAGFLKVFIYLSIFLLSLRFFREVVIIFAIIGLGEPMFKLSERNKKS